MPDKSYMKAASVETLVQGLLSHEGLYFSPDGTANQQLKSGDQFFYHGAISSELLARFSALEAERDALKARLAEAERHLEWAGPEVRAWQSLYPDQTTNKEREEVEHIDAFLHPQPPTAEGGDHEPK